MQIENLMLLAKLALKYQTLISVRCLQNKSNSITSIVVNQILYQVDIYKLKSYLIRSSQVS
jgi:hypothetical protein